VRFRVESSDNIRGHGDAERDQGANHGSDGRGYAGATSFFIPLSQQKTQLEQIPWVEVGERDRFCPNRLKVEIHERTPVAFAASGARIFLIDAGGTLMECHRDISIPSRDSGDESGEPLSTRTAHEGLRRTGSDLIPEARSIRRA